MKTSLALLLLVAFACSPVVRDPVPAGRTLSVRLADRAPESSKARLEYERDRQLAQAEVRAELISQTRSALRAANDQPMTVSATPVRAEPVQVEPTVPAFRDYLEPLEMAVAQPCPAGASAQGRPCAPQP